MAKVTGFTADRMLEIERSTVVHGAIEDADELVLYTRGGDRIRAGSIKGGTAEWIRDTQPVIEDHNKIIEDNRENIQQMHDDIRETAVVIEDLDERINVELPAAMDKAQNALDDAVAALKKASDTIKDATLEYAVSNSDTVAPTSGWSTERPARNPGQTIWMRTLVTKNNDLSGVYTIPIPLTGDEGDKGEKGDKGDSGADGLPGKDGVGLKATTISYAKSASGTTTPTSGWQSTVPDSTPGQFLWTRTVWTYTDSSSEFGYSVSQWGATGASGSDGIAGKDGVGITSTTITYAQSTSGTTPPSSDWTTNPPTPIAGHYIWTKTVWKYTDGTTETGYSVGKIGDTGAKGDKGDSGADGLPGKDGVGITKTAIEYAKSTSGTVTPTTEWQTTVPTSTPGQFLWTRTVWTYSNATTETGYSVSQWGPKGADGSDGIAGKDGVGISSTTITYAQSTSGTTPPTSDWQSTPPSPIAGRYIWTRTIWTYTDNSTETGYSVGKIGDTGAKGDKGDTGTDGLPGKAGVDGKDGVGITNTTIMYAKSTSGTTAPTTGWQTTVPASTPGQYLWTRTVWTYSDGDTETGYSVAQWGATGAKGDKGNTGNDGIAGKDGVGIASTIITYTQSTSGTTAPNTGWGANPPTAVAGRYIWTKTVWTYSDGTTETGYSVGKIGNTGAKGDKGEKGDTGADGLPGKDGVGLKSTTISYAKSTSGTTAPTSGWQSTVPTSTPGQFLWTRTVWAYTDNSSETSYSVAQWGATGAKGAKGDKGDTGSQGTPGTPGAKGDTGNDGIAGKDGVGIKTTTITYAQSTSGTTAPTTGWQSTPPTAVAGRYVWTKTVWSYTDGTNETGYSVGKIGNTGAKGDTGTDGLPGKDGIGLKQTTISYAKSASGTTTPTSGWQSAVPSSTPGQFLWTRTVWTYTDNTLETGYSVAQWGATGAKGDKGAKGDTGSDGIAGKDGVGITKTVITYAQSTSGTTPPSSGWTANPPTPIAGRYVWTKTVWTYSDGSDETGYSVGKIGDTGAKGDKGDTGSDGIAGKDGVGVTSTTIQYAKSTSGTVSPSTGWQNTVPTSTPGQYLWTRTVWTYSDTNTETGYSVAQWGATGAKGDKGAKGDTGSDGIAGKDGVGITKTVITYTQSTSGTTAPTTGWGANPPTPIAGRYIWTRTVWTYSDSTTETGYSVGKIGNTGTKGDKGDTGAQGVSVTSITPYYAKSSQNMFLGDPEVSNSLINAMYATTVTAGTVRPPEGIVYHVLGGSGTDGTLQSAASLSWLNTSTESGTVYFPVEGGKKYYCGLSWGVGGNFPSVPAASERTVRIYIGWYDKDRTFLSNSVFHHKSAGSFTTPFQKLHKVITAPDGATEARFYIQKNWWSSGSLFLKDIFFQPYTDAPWVDPVPPTTATPGLPWRDTEPSYVDGATLYRTDLVKFSNGSFSYTPMTPTDAWNEIGDVKAEGERALYVANMAQQAAEGLIVFGEEEPDHAPGRIWFKETTSTNPQGVEVTRQEILASNDEEWDIYTLMTGMLIVPARPDDTNNPDGVPTIVNQDGMTIGYVGAHTITGEVIEARTLKGEQLVLGSLSRKNLDKETQKAVDAAEEMDKFTIFEPGRVVVAEDISNKSGTPNVVSGVEILPRKMNFILEGNTSVYIDSSKSQIGAANVVATNSIYVGQHIIQQAKAGVTTVTFVGDL